jgi:hypothetical protein
MVYAGMSCRDASRRLRTETLKRHAGQRYDAPPLPAAESAVGVSALPAAVRAGRLPAAESALPAAESHATEARGGVRRDIRVAYPLR